MIYPWFFILLFRHIHYKIAEKFVSIKTKKYFFATQRNFFHIFKVLFSGMDEKTLIAECVKGNAKAQKTLFDKTSSKMMVVCLRYFPNRMEAEDILQDGYIKVFQNIGNYKHDGSFEGWMRRIFANTALDEIRRRKTVLEEQDVSDFSYKITNHEKTDGNLQADDLLKMVQELPDGYRIVFNMFAIEGYSHKEISDILEISENTSKSQFFRARALLRTQLEKIDFER